MNTLKLFCRPLLALAALLALAGCDTIVLNAPGDIAAQQGDLIVTATNLMLLIIVPVIALTFWFAWKYRASNTKAEYAPDWDHSVQLELIIWAAPLAIIIALGAITYITTHKLDPYRPLDRISADKPLPADVKPLVIEVVALDWKWLFFYPEQGIATVNEIAAPVDRPIQFKITSASVMNSFYIPAVAGMIYAMAGMETKLHGVINKPGEYYGLSTNYSGAGFSRMNFTFHGVSDAEFDAWIQKSRDSGKVLSREEYLELAKPSKFEDPHFSGSTRDPVRYYASVEPRLYHNILNLCADGQTMCMDEMMAIDMGMKPRPVKNPAGHEAAGHEAKAEAAAPAAHAADANAHAGHAAH